jgi:starch phosphorylase
MVKRDCGVDFDTDALFDIQVKRIHEYKRQLLNVLHVIHLYDRIKRGDTADWTPALRINRGQSCARIQNGETHYQTVNAVATVINSDPDVADC